MVINVLFKVTLEIMTKFILPYLIVIIQVTHEYTVLAKMKL